MNKLLTMTFGVALLVTVAGPAYAQKTVFVTRAAFTGNLGGLTGADEKCQAEADGPASIVPPGTYLAWLSDGIDSPDTRFTKSSHSYMLPDGTKIAEDFADLTDGSILHIINFDATGQNLGRQLFWSSTNADGTTAQPFLTCEGWMWTAESSTISHAMVGNTIKKSTLWSQYAREKCSPHLRLTCFQQ